MIEDNKRFAFFIKNADTILILLQLLPYFYYFYHLETSLDKNLAADSFRYLWKDGSPLSFFTNSSFTVRFFYFITGNNIDLIASLQLAFVAIAQIAIYKAFACRSLIQNLLLALLLLFLFSSHHSKWLYNFAMSDSLFITLYFLFATTVCTAKKGDSPVKTAYILAIAAAFIFSRNLAPYIALLTIAITFSLQLLYRNSSLRILLCIVALSLCSLFTTSKFDTSTELNAAQNIILKVFPDQEKVDLFHEKYGMPIGPFISACRGGNVNAYCFNYQRVQTGSTYTRTYKVTTDDFYFADWIRNKGMHSWQHYLFIHDLNNTFVSFYFGYTEKFHNIFKQIPGDFWGEQYRTPFEKWDPFFFLHKAFLFLHFDNLISLSIIILCSILFYFITSLKKEFECATVLLIGGMALFFIGYFGDISSDRQVYPGILSIYLGIILFLFLTIQVIFAKLKSMYIQP